MSDFQFEDLGLNETDVANLRFRAQKAICARGAFASHKMLVAASRQERWRAGMKTNVLIGNS
jgi:hypothetical protein